MTDHSPEPFLPFPPRRWWLKRSAAGFVILASVMAGTRWAWGWAADRQFQQRLSLYAARHEPVNIADLNPTDGLPAGRNAASYYLRASSSRNPAVASPAESMLTFAEYPPFPRAWDRMMQAAYVGNAQALQLMRTARSYDEADWGSRYSPTALLPMLSNMNAARSLANLTGDVAIYDHLNGNDAEALERIQDVRHLAKIVGQEPLLISHLVSIGIEALALQRLEVIASGLTLQGETKNNPAARPATREQIGALILELLNDSDKSQALQSAVRTERAYALEVSLLQTSNLWLVRPMVQRDLVRLADEFDIAIRLARNPVPSAAASAKPPVSSPRSSLYAATMFSVNPSQAAERTIIQEAKINAERRMAALSLAAQLYRADHGGEWPSALEALVPGYLPEMPLDPFGGGERLKYLLVPHGRPDGRDRPLVYSVGENQQDDSVEASMKGMALLPAEPTYSWGFRTLDQWRDLSRWAPPPGARQTSGLPNDGSIPETSGTDDDPTTQPSTPDAVEESMKTREDEPKKADNEGEDSQRERGGQNP